MIPLASTTLDFSDGNYEEGAISLAGDVTLVVSLGASSVLSAAEKSARAAWLADKALKTAKGIEIGVAVYRVGQTAYAVIQGDWEQAFSHGGDATLRLLGLSAEQVLAFRAAKNAKAALANGVDLGTEVAEATLGQADEAAKRLIPQSADAARDALIIANRDRSAAMQEQYEDVFNAWRRYQDKGGDLTLPEWKKKYDILQANRATSSWAESFGEPGQVYSTPYGRRVVDNAPAIEIKSGYASRTKFIRKQIVKDMWLKRNVEGYNPVWRFVDEEPSAPLLRHLELMGIPYQLPGEF